MTEMKQTSNAFGKSVQAILSKYGMTKMEFAHYLQVSPSYVTQFTKGRSSKPSASLVNRVADVLRLTPEERFDLHMDAATDHGFFKLDLTKE